MKRIIIIGPSGAGKTTLAVRLAEILDIPHTELDSINHQPNWQPINKLEFKKRVNDITRQPEWIFCGNYFSTLGLDFWRQADTIIWCDYSFARSMSRLLRRTLKRTLTRKVLWNGNRESFYTNFFTKESIFVWMRKSLKKQKIRYGEIFNNSDDFDGLEFVRLKTPRQTKEFVDTIKTEAFKTQHTL